MGQWRRQPAQTLVDPLDMRPGAVHEDRRLPPRLRGLRIEANPGLRGQLMADRTFLDWPFFEDTMQYAILRKEWAAKR